LRRGAPAVAGDERDPHAPLPHPARRVVRPRERVACPARRSPGRRRASGVITVAIARGLADEHGERIVAAGGGRIRLLPLRGEEGEAPLDDVEIAVYGLFDGPLSFRDLAGRMRALRWIHSTGAGIDSFVSPELAARDVIVTNSSGVYATAMVEYALAGMVAVARDFRRLFAQQGERRWNHEPVSGRELHGKRVGIVGYGATGRYLATVCKALGM